MQKGGWIYIMTNKPKGTLYTGVTSRLVERVYEHRTNLYEHSFTKKYNCKMLVYYLFFNTIENAIAEEKRIKAGNRNAKLKLIENINPQWNDLWEEITK